ncbi:uncharacterized protein LOC124493089 isoform X2 [Dermatophagoides farinae]|uniref:Uncharacterized protein n=1 Tax=Dermatophagoides farinae TaxID=6954 RepID=A0A922IFN6_DERFA|nr:uncharacterized protein LOC124493089 isoform X2 [Dermatophagoides farinae]KAH7642450.1 hypothetical protein HUG17_5495 [Dermatophagoides farinae]KAH9529716.1 hypothetical protein DERF_003585 [Dermatophagoides farinae]
MSGQPPEPGQQSFGVPIYNQPGGDNPPGPAGYGEHAHFSGPNNNGNYGMGVVPPNNTPSFGEPQYHRPGLAEPTYRVPGVGIGLGATVPGTEPGLGTYVGSDLPPPPSCGNSDN